MLAGVHVQYMSESAQFSYCDCVLVQCSNVIAIWPVLILLDVQNVTAVALLILPMLDMGICISIASECVLVKPESIPCCIPSLMFTTCIWKIIADCLCVKE